MPFQPRPLGRAGFVAGAIGLSASYGAPAKSVEYAFDHGVNYMYWGSMRRDAFAQGLRRLAARRERYALVVQSYSPVAALIPGSLERALASLRTDYADVLLLGMWNRAVPPRVMDICRGLKQRGLIRHIAVSTHHRPLVPQLARGADVDIVHLRYNAEHSGAERDVFPLLPESTRPGIVAFTATSWRRLLSGKKLPEGERAPTATDCYRFVLSNPSVDLCMTGPADMAQVRDALKALELGPLTEEEMAWMRRVGAHLYAHRPKLPWS